MRNLIDPGERDGLLFLPQLIPNRPTFALDMTPEEREIMQRHAAYWTAHMRRGRVHVFGPVMDPAGVYGVGVVEAEYEAEVHALASSDPAAAINHFEIYPMHAVLPQARSMPL